MALLLAAPVLRADDDTVGPGVGAAPAADALLADIRVHTAEEVAAVVERLEALADGGRQDFPSHQPVIMLLHGDEAETFTRQNYPRYKDTVDRAARLEAFGLLDVRVCERWMESRDVQSSDLPPFVQTVRDGAAEERRLERAGYVRF